MIRTTVNSESMSQVFIPIDNSYFINISDLINPLINANNYDMRYLDPASTIMGLTYHRTGANYVNHKYIEPDEDLEVGIIRECEEEIGFKPEKLKYLMLCRQHLPIWHN